MILRAIELSHFLERKTPPRRAIFGEWLLERTTVLVSGQSGAGKSFFVNSLGLAIAGQIRLFDWAPRGEFTVGIFDGENDECDIRERMEALQKGLGVGSQRVRILSQSTVEEQLGRSISLSDSLDRQLVLKAFEGCDLLIVDNVNCCFDVTDENSTKDWGPVQDLVMAVRSAGMALILVHHTPKSNPSSPAGSSKNVRAFDLSLLITRTDASKTVGASFVLSIHKSRRAPKDLKAMQAELIEVEGALKWVVSDPPEPVVEDTQTAKRSQVLQLRAAGKSLRDIEQQTGVSRSTAQRLITQTG
jgi:RecA-family ATPase